MASASNENRNGETLLSPSMNSLPQIKLSPESGNAWWFHSELTYPKELIDLPPLPSKNVIQWIPFGTHDVAHLESAYEDYLKSPARPEICDPEFLRKDELEVPERFVKVKCETRQYLKVDLERMRMGPIYWQGQEYFIRRATWFLVPEGARITEGFPVERGLENLLTQRYDETLSWIDRSGPEYAAAFVGVEKSVPEAVESGGGGGYDETIVEKIVPLIPEDPSNDLFGPSEALPTIQLHDPQAPDVSRYFLVFRQGCNDYARLCVEKKLIGSGKKGGGRDSIGKSPQMPATLISPSGSSSLEGPSAVLPLDSINPISATSSVLSTSVSMTDLREGHANVDQAENNRASMAASPSPSMTSPQGSIAGSNGYHSFRLYRTYASFYHTVASGAEGPRARVQTQRQTSEIEETKETKTKSAESSNRKSTSNNSNYNSNINSSSSMKGSVSAAIDAAVAWKGVKSQAHSFKGHPLPSPEIPFDFMNESPGRAAKYVIFVVHGVGQRAFRKMGFHFNKDCDDMRNVLLDAAQARGLAPGSVVVLPISWRAELNLAGNFNFGDDDFEEEGEEEGENDHLNKGDNNNNTDTNNNTTTTTSNREFIDEPVDKDLEELQKSFNTKIEGAASSFQRAVSVFEGQFTEILERLALESIPAVRSVLSDATMDILLYVSQKHFERILGAVIKEVLRMHSLFAHWNPEYSGEFSFVAHSLGSALVADLLSFTVQPDEFLAKMKLKTLSNGGEESVKTFLSVAEGNVFPFKVDKFFAFGSPLGVFHLLKHTKPIGCLHSPHISAAIESRSRKWSAARRRPGGDKVKDVPAWTIYNCRLFYNVFHPHDPVAHRFESLSLLRARNNVTNTSSNNANTSSSTNNNNNSSNTGELPPPLKIPYHKSGLTRFKMDLEAKIARAKDDWARMTLKLPSWLGGSSSKDEKSSERADDDSTKANKRDTLSHTASSTNQSLSNVYDENPLAAFNHHFRRVDFSLQDAVMENAYISALGAHFIYWSDLDIAAFIVSELIKN